MAAHLQAPPFSAWFPLPSCSVDSGVWWLLRNWSQSPDKALHFACLCLCRRQAGTLLFPGRAICTAFHLAAGLEGY